MAEVNIQGSSNIHFGPSFEFVNMTSAFFTTETIWAEVNIGQKCKKWWWLTKLMLKKAFIRDWKLTSANSKFTWKTPWTLEIDSLDHLKIFDLRDYFLIRAIFGPKTACELERLFKIIKKSQKHDQKSNFWFDNCDWASVPFRPYKLGRSEHSRSYKRSLRPIS